jgi:hypothetical protein
MLYKKCKKVRLFFFFFLEFKKKIEGEFKWFAKLSPSNYILLWYFLTHLISQNLYLLMSILINAYLTHTLDPKLFMVTSNI